MDNLCFCSVLSLLCLSVRLFICALWSPAEKRLTTWLSFVVSYREFVTFPLVSWVRCGTSLYRFLGQMWYFIVSIPDLCTLTYLERVIHCEIAIWRPEPFNVKLKSESVKICLLAF